MAKEKFSLIKSIQEDATERAKQEEKPSLLSDENVERQRSIIREALDKHHELKRIAKYWEQYKDQYSDDELREQIGMDLEQLEYSPEEQADAIPKIIDMIENGVPTIAEDKIQPKNKTALSEDDKSRRPTDDEFDQAKQAINDFVGNHVEIGGVGVDEETGKVDIELLDGREYTFDPENGQLELVSDP